MIDALVGKYRLQNGLGIELRHTGNSLTIQADGQPEFEMGHDNAGDFYPLKFDALLRPKRKADGTYIFTWFQLGGVLEAERIGPPATVASKWTPTETQLKDYGGNYPLTPNFALRIFSTGAKLFVQGTNQKLDRTRVCRKRRLRRGIRWRRKSTSRATPATKWSPWLSSSGDRSCRANDTRARMRAAMAAH